ncbi:YhgE/Pip domain-containing protein [Eggerthellaceae bacterium zg-997]|nr:YhgE/Pip domain-containing protein [Eggerthellaceae bacterium zg-997]
MHLKGLRFALAEVRNNMAGPAMKAVLAVIGVIPLLYGALYLYAFMDPYQTFDTLPVAVVIEDRGAVVDGRQRNVGAELRQRLEDSDQRMGWNFVDAQEAQDGLEQGRFFMVATVPADFTEKVASAQTDTPAKAALLVNYDQASNLLASQLGSAGWKAVRSQLSEAIAEEYWKTAFSSINDGASRLDEAADRAEELTDGATRARNGAARLGDGAFTLRAALGTLDDGLGDLADGAGQLKDGTSRLSAGTQALSAGAHRLADGVARMSEGTSELQRSGTARIAAGSGQLNAAVGDLPSDDQVRQLQQASARLQQGLDSMGAGIGGAGDTDATTLYGGVNRLAAGIDDLNGNIGRASDDAAAGTLRGAANAEAAAYEAAIAALQAGDTAAAQRYLGQARQLAAGVASAHEKLAAGAQSLSVGAESLKSGLDRLSTGAGDVSDGYRQLAGTVGPLVSAAPRLKSAASQLSNGAAELDRKAGQLAAGAATLSSGADEASGKVEELASGAARLDAGAGELTDGTARAQDGARQVAHGADQLGDGAGELTDGLQRLTDGSADLRDGLADASSSMTVSGPDARAAMMAAPVELSETRYTSVLNYGTGFAPYFISLGLWVGALMVSFVFRPLNTRLITSGANPALVTFSSYVPLAVMATLQALLLLLVLQFGLNLQIDHVGLFYGLGILTALVFAAIIQTISAALGVPGRVVAIVLLMLQLTSAAGTFPLELTPPFFQVISPFLPMTHSVSALRQAMCGNDLALAATGAAILLAVGAASLTLTAVVASRRRFVTMKDLHPLIKLS